MKLHPKAGAALLALLVSTPFFCTPLLASASAGEGASSLPQEQADGETSANQAQETTAPAEGTSTTGFHVRARTPENQTDNNLTYFSLMMEPGQEQVLEIEVVNEGGEEIYVDVDAVSASTNPNGIIDYKTPDVADEILRHPFGDLAVVEQAALQIPAGETGVATVRVTMPAEEYDGAILGGLVFTKRPPEANVEENENGAMIQNVYTYALAVVLRENENPVQPDFELAGVETNLFDNQPSFIHSIRNREPYVVKQMQVTASVYAGDDTNGTPVATRTQELVDMAPDSVLEFAVAPEDGTLEGGTYTTVVVLQLDGEEWRFSDSFMLQDAEATLVNDLAPFASPTAATTPEAAGGSFNTLLVVVIVALVLLVVILALALLTRKNRGGRRGRR